MRKKEFSYFSFQNFFSDFARKSFQTFGQNPQEVVTTNFCVSRLTIWGLKFFLKFWIVLHFLQKPLAWSSKFYLRVQSKICGRNSYFLFFFSVFFRILAIYFATFVLKTSKVFKTFFCVSRGTICAFKFFLKLWTVMDFLQKPLAWFSSFYGRVQSKICGRKSFFYSSFLNFSGFWAKNFSDFWPKNVKNLSKLPSTCPEEQFVAWFF